MLNRAVPLSVSRVTLSLARGMGPPWRVIEDARRAGLGQAGRGALAVGRSFDDQGMGRGGQPVDGRLKRPGSDGDSDYWISTSGWSVRGAS